MGVTPKGWAELLVEDRWVPLCDLDFCMDRGMVTAFLFGVGITYDVVPLAARRGFPVDLSPEVASVVAQCEARDDVWDRSWIGWEEISELDPEANIVGFHFTAYLYEQHGDKLRELEELWGPRFDEIVGQEWNDVVGLVNIPDLIGKTMVADPYLVRFEYVKVHTVLSEYDWPVLWQYFESLSEANLRKNIRIVSWVMP
jgi:hypothetical protein